MKHLFSLSFWIAIPSALLFTGCYQNHFYVQKEWIDASYLASSHVNTPDPRQECPPIGERLVVCWNFPQELFDQNLTLELTVRFWNGEEKTFYRPLNRKHDHEIFFFPIEERQEMKGSNGMDQKILTYHAQARTEEGEIVGLWEHQLWTKLIRIEDSVHAHRTTDP